MMSRLDFFRGREWKYRGVTGFVKVLVMIWVENVDSFAVRVFV